MKGTWLKIQSLIIKRTEHAERVGEVTKVGLLFYPIRIHYNGPGFSGFDLA